jgi:hypothetical protein
VRRRLRAVDEHHRARRVRRADDLLDRVDRAERVRDVDHGDQLRPLREQAPELVHPQLAAIVDRHDPQPRPGLLADDLPGDDVRVVLHPRDEHLVARLQERAAPGLGDEVDALRAPLRQDHLPALRRVDEALQGDARPLVGARRALAEQVRGPVDVRVVGAVERVQRVDDLPRLLRRVRVVEVDERLPVHLLVQDGEVGPYRSDVEWRDRYRHEKPPTLVRSTANPT